MKRAYYILLLVIPFLSFKKFLDAKPDSKLTVPQTLNDLQALLDASFLMNLQQSPSFGEASCDDYFLSSATFNSLPVEHQSIYTWNREEYRFQNDWSKAYLPVYNANYSLEQLEKIPVTSSNEEQWKNVKGSAFFFRGYNYLNLLWVYAKAYDETTAGTDLGIVLRSGSDFNSPSVRASISDCYEQVINDGKEAVKQLTANPVHVMRPSKAAAYGLLARCYLSMRKYDSAYRYADLCLTLKNNLMDYNGDADINGSIVSNTPFKKFNKETIFYTEMNGNSFFIYPSNICIDTSVYAQYHPDDLRKAVFYKTVSGYQQYKGSYTGSDVYFTGLATDEMFLVRAECLARIGRIAEAMNDLNTLMQKRWRNAVPYPIINATDQIDAVNKILAERRKELYMRGLRWMDIKRLNKEGQNITPQRRIGTQLFMLQPNTSYYALPIPADIIEQTGIPQN